MGFEPTHSLLLLLSPAAVDRSISVLTGRLFFDPGYRTPIDDTKDQLIVGSGSMTKKLMWLFLIHYSAGISASGFTTMPARPVSLSAISSVWT